MISMSQSSLDISRAKSKFPASITPYSIPNLYSRLDEANPPTMFFESLQDLAHNSIRLVKMLLALGLSQGKFAYPSIHALLGDEVICVSDAALDTGLLRLRLRDIDQKNQSFLFPALIA